MHFHISCCPILSICLHVPQSAPPRKWPSGQFLCKYHRNLIFQFQILKDRTGKSEHLVENEKATEEENPQPVQNMLVYVWLPNTVMHIGVFFKRKFTKEKMPLETRNWEFNQKMYKNVRFESVPNRNLTRNRGHWKPGIENSIEQCIKCKIGIFSKQKFN